MEKGSAALCSQVTFLANEVAHSARPADEFVRADYWTATDRRICIVAPDGVPSERDGVAGDDDVDGDTGALEGREEGGSIKRPPRPQDNHSPFSFAPER